MIGPEARIGRFFRVASLVVLAATRALAAALPSVEAIRPTPLGGISAPVLGPQTISILPAAAVPFAAGSLAPRISAAPASAAPAVSILPPAAAPAAPSAIAPARSAPAAAPASAAELDHLYDAVRLSEELGFRPDEIHFDKKYPMVLRQGVGPSPSIRNPGAPITSSEKYDVIIVGSGPSAQAAAVYLTDQGKKVLMLEKNSDFGGLAAVGQRNGTVFGRGGAYFYLPERDWPKMRRIFKHLGLVHEKRLAIPGAIDSYLWNGRYYGDIWSKKTLKELPASFAALKYAILSLDEKEGIPYQPWDMKSTRKLDPVSMAEWVRGVPAWLEKRAKKDDKAARLLQRMKDDPSVDQSDPMKGPLGLLDIYGRSALADHADVLGAGGFLNFYKNELEQRYTGRAGSGQITRTVLKTLSKRGDLVQVRTGAAVTSIAHTFKEVDVQYEMNGELHQARADDVIFAAPMGLATRVIKGYEEADPKHFKAASELKYRDYMVVNVHVEGHPWTKAYDLWIRRDDGYSKKRITDVVEGRWMEFEGGKKARLDDKGLLTVYMPLDEEESALAKGPAEAEAIAERAIDQMIEEMTPLTRKTSGLDIKVRAAEVNVWRDAIHLTTPGHFERSRILSRPVGRVYFANNNLGTPSVEEALYRGYRAAKDILDRTVEKSGKLRARLARLIAASRQKGMNS